MAVKTKTLELKAVAGPHNGRDPWRSPDPVTGAPIGGQIAYIRGALRRKRFVAPWGRRAGKTTGRPFLYVDEAPMTVGRYTVAFITVNHVKAWEFYQFCFRQFGGLVKDGGMIVAAVGEPESQNRYVDLAPINWTPERVPRAYRECPVIGPRIAKAMGRNTGSRIYFLSGQYPTVTAVQGFPFPFDRISIDEAQQIHPGVTKIVNPMLMDSGGSLDVSGIADIDEMGNDWFSEYYERGLDPKRAHRWASLNFPTYCNPNLDAEATKEVEDDLLTNDDYEQYILAKFLSGSGAVFSNLDKVFVLAPVWQRTQPAHTDGPAWWKSLFLREPSDVMRTWIHEADPTPGHSYAMTVDFAGRTKTRDATVIEVYDMTENKMVCDVSIRGMRSPGQLAWIEGVKDHYGAHEVHGDETPEGAALMGYLRERYKTGVIGHIFSASNKAEYVKRGVFLFEMGEVRLIDAPEIKNEFRIFRRVVSESLTGKDGPVSYSHPPGKNDDHVTSFLQIAQSMAHGRRAEAVREEPLQSVVDDQGMTTLSKFFGDERGLPSFREDGENADKTWQSVVVPRR